MQSIVKERVIKALKTDKENDPPNLLPLSMDHGPTMGQLKHSEGFIRHSSQEHHKIKVDPLKNAFLK